MKKIKLLFVAFVLMMMFPTITKAEEKTIEVKKFQIPSAGDAYQTEKWKEVLVKGIETSNGEYETLINWYNNESDKLMQDGDVFEDGKNYRFELTVSSLNEDPADGYVFDVAYVLFVDCKKEASYQLNQMGRKI